MTPADGFTFAAPTLAEAPEIAALLGVETSPRHRRAVLLPSADVDPNTQAECDSFHWPCPRHSAHDYATRAARHRSDR